MASRRASANHESRPSLRAPAPPLPPCSSAASLELHTRTATRVTAGAHLDARARALDLAPRPHRQQHRRLLISSPARPPSTPGTAPPPWRASLRAQAQAARPTATRPSRASSPTRTPRSRTSWRAVSRLSLVLWAGEAWRGGPGYRSCEAESAQQRSPRPPRRAPSARPAGQPLAPDADARLSLSALAAQKRLRDLKARISAQSKKNFVLERDVRYLDSRIALLIQNVRRLALRSLSSLSLRRAAADARHLAAHGTR